MVFPLLRRPSVLRSFYRNTTTRHATSTANAFKHPGSSPLRRTALKIGLGGALTAGLTLYAFPPTLYADSSSYTLTDYDMDEVYAVSEQESQVPSTVVSHKEMKTVGKMNVRLFASSEETYDGFEVLSYGAVVDHRDNAHIVVSSPIASATLTYPTAPGQSPSTAATSTFTSITITNANPNPNPPPSTPTSPSSSSSSSSSSSPSSSPLSSKTKAQPKPTPSAHDLGQVHSVLMSAFLYHYVDILGEVAARLAYGDHFDNPPPPNGMSPSTYPDPKEQLDIIASGGSSPTASPSSSSASQPDPPQPIYVPGSPLPNLGLEGFHQCLMGTVVAIDDKFPGTVDPDVCSIGVASFYHRDGSVCLGFNGAGNGAVRAVVGRRKRDGKKRSAGRDKEEWKEATRNKGAVVGTALPPTWTADPDYQFELFDGEPPSDVPSPPDSLHSPGPSPATTDLDIDSASASLSLLADDLGLETLPAPTPAEFDPTRPYITTCTPDPFGPRSPPRSTSPSTSASTSGPAQAPGSAPGTTKVDAGVDGEDGGDFVVLASGKVWEVLRYEEVGRIVADANRRKWKRLERKRMMEKNRAKMRGGGGGGTTTKTTIEDLKDDAENPAWVLTNEVLERNRRRAGGNNVDTAFAIQVVVL